MSREDSNPNAVCPSCGASFVCGAREGSETCWCFALPPVPAVSGSEEECLCPACLRRLAEPAESGPTGDPTGR